MGIEERAHCVSKSDFLLPANGGMKATVQISLRKPSKGMGWGCCLGDWLFCIPTEQERKGDLLQKEYLEKRRGFLELRMIEHQNRLLS